MNNVRAFATAKSCNNAIRVYLNRHYESPAPVAIDIPLDPSVRENLIIAELLALRYGLSVLHLAANRLHGSGIRAICSFGAIRKLTRHDSAFAHLAPYAQFLCTRYAGAVVEVDNRRPVWADDSLVTAVYEIDNKPVFEKIESVMGPLLPTSHVIERVVERNVCSDKTSAFRVMHNHLSNDIVELGWSADASKRCRQKHGKTSRLLYHVGSRTMYVVAEDKRHSCPVIVTAYTVLDKYFKTNGIERKVA